MMKKIIKILLLLCFFTVTAVAAIIRGVVTDAETDEPLAGVNVVLRGTYYGAATDVDGSYVITGMGPGTYDMVVSMIGYKQYIHGGIELEKENPDVLMWHWKVPCSRSGRMLSLLVKNRLSTQPQPPLRIPSARKTLWERSWKVLMISSVSKPVSATYR
ncbi:MAG: carboxypeptidase-like regulatory domain-containing protein [Candidatus Marinimicrobia bacterium]|nr:carboxypeptidase-like regulatory domain-containing protein [Candidatus Neomarinimicrobiota bacterium]